MTRLEILHRLQLSFISGNGKWFHLCDIVKGFDEVPPTLVLDVTELIMDKIYNISVHRIGHYAFGQSRLEDFMRVPASYELENEDDLWTINHHWHADSKMYHLRLRIINELIAEQTPL